MGAELQVLLGGELEKGAAAIGHVRDAAARNLLGSLAIDAAGVEADFSLRPDHPAHGAQGRGLAGAVGAEDRGDAALVQSKVYAVQDFRLRVERA